MKAKLLKKAIDSQYKSVRQFAEAVGIPSSTLQSAIDKDAFSKMQIGTVIKICDALGLDVKTFQPIVSLAWEPPNQEESEILTLYRQAEPTIKEAVRSVLKCCTPDMRGKYKEFESEYERTHGPHESGST